MVERILVIGAGIGGLATAIALRQRDFTVDVVEKQPDLHATVYGVGIIQPPNALRALDAIGCAAACLEEGYAAAAWGRKYDQAGHVLGDVPGVSIEGTHYPPMNGITRPRLHRILTARALKVGASIAYDLTFEQLEQESDRVAVRFTDGSRDAYDLVVGADGIRSAVRPSVLDAGVEPTSIGQSAFRVNIPRDADMDRIILQEGDSGMAGIVPIGADIAYLFMNVPADKGWRVPTDRLREELTAKLGGFGGIVGRVRDASIAAGQEIVLRPEEYLIVPAPWHRGRIVLIGDAVHTVTPHLGQGAAQAIEDGVVLAESLATIPDLDDALRAYAERRFERCRLIVETSAAIGEFEKHPTPGFDHVGVTQRVMQAMAAPI